MRRVNLDESRVVMDAARIRAERSVRGVVTDWLAGVALGAVARGCNDGQEIIVFGKSSSTSPGIKVRSTAGPRPTSRREGAIVPLACRTSVGYVGP